jgi:hypothetical protein
MEAELTRHFMNNVAEEPDMSSGAGPPPYVSAPPSYHSSNSAPASLASSHPAPASPETSLAVGTNSIPGVLNAQEESVQVLQQKLKEVQYEFLIFFNQIQISRTFTERNKNSSPFKHAPFFLQLCLFNLLPCE